MLGAIEAALMLVLYFVVVPNSLDSIEGATGLTGHNTGYHFAFEHSTEDILISSLIRVVLLSISYGFGSGKYCHRPYFAVAMFTSMFLIPYAIVKAAVTNLRPVGPVVSLVTTSIAFSVVHVIVARQTVIRTQRRLNMGLIGFGYPWEEGEHAWVMAGRRQSLRENSVQDDLLYLDFDVPRGVLADPDSKFVDCGELSVHYKEACPRDLQAVADPSFAVVFIHGFGAGAFAWRNLMQPLAELCGCRVIAFDRPAFGLTSRPQVRDDGPNPYTAAYQKRLTIKLCQLLGIRRTILVGHSDGCILSLLVAASMRSWKSAELKQLGSLQSRSISTSSGQEQPAEIGRSIRTPHNTPTPSNRSCYGSPTDDKAAPDGSGPSSWFETVPPSCFENVPAGDSTVLHPNPGLEVEAIIFLHPDFQCDEGLSFTGLLLQSKLGRKFLRPLLRSEIGEVANRRAWYDTFKLTHQILDLYKMPLRVQGWDSALVESTRVRSQVTAQHIAECRRRVAGLPTMVVTGEKDRIVPPEKAAHIADEFGSAHLSIVPDCGHISHEECPEMLLDVLVSFVEHMYGGLRNDSLGG